MHGSFCGGTSSPSLASLSAIPAPGRAAATPTGTWSLHALNSLLRRTSNSDPCPSMKRPLGGRFRSPSGLSLTDESVSMGALSTIPSVTTVVGDAVMPKATYFVQECPTCGRRLQIRVEYLGKRMACQHCRGQFEAADPAAHRPSDSSVLMARAEELLSSSKANPSRG